MRQTMSVGSPLAFIMVLALGCSSQRPITARHDGAERESSDARTKLAPKADLQQRVADARTPPPPTADTGPTVSKADTGSPRPVCPGPCPRQHDCVAVFPNTTAGICLKPCSKGCGGCGAPCSQCLVQISGVRYCMDMCAWKGSTDPCPDPANQACVDAYSVPNNLLSQGYPGSRICVPK